MEMMNVTNISETVLDGLINMLEVCIGEGIGGNDESNRFIKKLWIEMYGEETEKPWWWEIE